MEPEGIEPSYFGLQPNALPTKLKFLAYRRQDSNLQVDFSNLILSQVPPTIGLRRLVLTTLLQYFSVVKRPQTDSNCHQRLRRPVFCPLNYRAIGSPGETRTRNAVAPGFESGGYTNSPTGPLSHKESNLDQSVNSRPHCRYAMRE